MNVFTGRKYIYQFSSDYIYLDPIMEGIKTITIQSRYDEDFSIFDFGPEVCKEIEMGVDEVVSEDIGVYHDCFMRISMPNPGNNIEIFILNFDGSEILHITDLIYKYNRGTDVLDNVRTATLDDAEWVDNPAIDEEEIEVPDDTGEEVVVPPDEPEEPDNPDEPENPDEPDEPEIPETTPDNTLVFDNGEVHLGYCSGMVVYTSPSGLKEIAITDSEEYTITGYTANTIINISSGTGTANIVFEDLLIDNSNLVDVMFGDSPTLELQDSTNLNITIKGNNIFYGADENSDSQPIFNFGETDSVRFFGDGNLSIVNISNDCIESNADITFMQSGTISIDGSLGNGITAKRHTVTINDGTIDITNCYGDGIQSEVFVMNDGNLNIQTAYKAPGKLYYTSGSGSPDYNWINEVGNIRTERINIDTGSHKGLNIGTKALTKVYLTSNNENVVVPNLNYHTEGSGEIVINGGNININTSLTGIKFNRLAPTNVTSISATSNGVYIIGSPDDAICSYGNITIKDANMRITSSNNALTASGMVFINGNTKLDIDSCYKGIEGNLIRIGISVLDEESPEITINPRDNGINAVSKSMRYVYEDDTESKYTKYTTFEGGNECSILSGRITINIDSEISKIASYGGSVFRYVCIGDGIDCVGSLSILGGYVFIYGQSTGENSPVDTDTGFTLGPDAFVIFTGIDQMNNSSPKNGGGHYVKYGNQYNNTSGPSSIQTGSVIFGAGSNLRITNTSGVIFVQQILPYKCSFVLVSNPQWTRGDYLTLRVGNNSYSVSVQNA